MNKYKEIIKRMRSGKRLNISEVARELNLPISTVSDRIRKIEENFVRKRTSLLEYPKLGYHSHAKIAVSINHNKKQGLLDFLREQECVNSIFHINTGYDFLIEVVHKNPIELKSWVLEMKSMFGAEAQIFNILRIEKVEGFMPK